MSLFAVDQEKCKRDGICAAECPMGIIELKDKQSVPTPIDEAEKLCIQCGHCVAVCPHGAFSLKTMTPEMCPPLRKDWLFTSEQVEHFMRSRRSIRTYKDQPVDKQILTKLIDIARYAPSGHNSQPVMWHVIYDSSEVQKLAGIVVDWMRAITKEQPSFAKMMHLDRVVKKWEQGIDAVCRKAPHIIITHAHKGNRVAPTACTIALTWLELAAPSFGLGTCWAGYFNVAATLWPSMQKALLLPEEHVCLGAMMIGYPKFKYHRLPIRKDAQITWR